MDYAPVNSTQVMLSTDEIRKCVSISILRNPKVTGSIPLTFRIQITSLTLTHESEQTSFDDTPVTIGIIDIDSKLGSLTFIIR